MIELVVQLEAVRSVRIHRQFEDPTIFSWIVRLVSGARVVVHKERLFAVGDHDSSDRHSST